MRTLIIIAALLLIWIAVLQDLRDKKRRDYVVHAIPDPVDTAAMDFLNPDSISKIPDWRETNDSLSAQSFTGVQVIQGWPPVRNSDTVRVIGCEKIMDVRDAQVISIVWNDTTINFHR